VRERPPVEPSGPGIRAAGRTSQGGAPSLAQSESSLAWSLTESSFVDLSTDPHAAMSIALAIIRRSTYRARVPERLQPHAPASRLPQPHDRAQRVPPVDIDHTAIIIAS
jgi:hypothetical protein